MHLRTWGSAAAGKGWKVTIAGTIHDMMAHLRHVGASNRQLRQKSNCQNGIFLPQQGQTTDLFEIIYKHSKGHTTPLYHSTKNTP